MKLVACIRASVRCSRIFVLFSRYLLLIGWNLVSSSLVRLVCIFVRAAVCLTVRHFVMECKPLSLFSSLLVS